MHEINKRTTGTLSAMQPDLEYIPVCSDPRGVHMSEMHKEGACPYAMLSTSTPSTYVRNAQGRRGPQGDPYPDREAVNAV